MSGSDWEDKYFMIARREDGKTLEECAIMRKEIFHNVQDAKNFILDNDLGMEWFVVSANPAWVVPNSTIKNSFH